MDDQEIFEPSKLDPLRRRFLKCVLKETINQLIIANSGEKHVLTVQKRKPIHVRFESNNKTEQSFKNERITGKIRDVMQRMIFVKLRNDISRFRKVLSDELEELEFSGRLQAIADFVEEEASLEQEEEDLIQEYARNKRLLSLLEKKHRKDVESFKNHERELDSRIYDLEQTAQNCRTENVVKNKLVQLWEMSRHEQAKLILDNSEKELSEALENAHVKTEWELTLKTKIGEFLQNAIATLNAQIDSWIERLNRETTQLDADIQSTGNKIKEIKSRYEELIIVFQARQIEIDAYMVEKRKKQAIKNFADLQWASAVKIQAWWRGCMVRRGLGPYRKKAKKRVKKAPPKGKGKK